MEDYSGLMEANFRCGIEVGRAEIVEETIKELFSKSYLINKGALLSKLYNELSQDEKEDFFVRINE